MFGVSQFHSSTVHAGKTVATTHGCHGTVAVARHPHATAGQSHCGTPGHEASQAACSQVEHLETVTEKCITSYNGGIALM